MRFNRTVWILICVGLLLLVVIGGVRHLRNAPRSAQTEKAGAPFIYTILQDDRGKTLNIGVQCPIDEKNLKATLIKAANDHQNDAARDYLISKYFYVKAYIVNKDRVSSVPAGIIERYVPPRNPRIKEEPLSDADKEDEFEITIREAINSLSAQGTGICYP